MNPKKIFGDAKPCVHFIPLEIILEEALVMKEGGSEYGRFNWRVQRIDASTYVDAIFRHFIAWAGGEDIDPKSGRSHLAHIRANCGIVWDAQQRGCMNDDRLCQEAKEVNDYAKKAQLYASEARDYGLPAWHPDHPLNHPKAEPPLDPCPPEPRTYKFQRYPPQPTFENTGDPGARGGPWWAEPCKEDPLGQRNWPRFRADWDNGVIERSSKIVIHPEMAKVMREKGYWKDEEFIESKMIPVADMI